MTLYTLFYLSDLRIYVILKELMGRSLSFYAVKANSTHQTGKRICLDWEYERDYQEVIDELYEHFHKDFNIQDYKTHSKAKQDFYNNNQPYSTLKPPSYQTKFNPDWCERCAIFAEGLMTTIL